MKKIELKKIIKEELKSILSEEYDFKKKQNQYFLDAKNKYLDDVENVLKSMGVKNLSRIVDRYDRPNTLEGNGWDGKYRNNKIKILFSISGYSLYVVIAGEKVSPRFTSLTSMTAWMEKNLE